MGIPLISNIEPRNGRDFAIAHADDIDVKASKKKLLPALADGDLTPPAVTVGEGVPTSTPTKQGLLHLDVSGKKIYYSAEE